MSELSLDLTDLQRSHITNPLALARAAVAELVIIADSGDLDHRIIARLQKDLAEVIKTLEYGYDSQSTAMQIDQKL